MPRSVDNARWLNGFPVSQTADPDSIIALDKNARLPLSTVYGASIYGIGEQGKVGFGVGAIRDADLPAGYTKFSGHDDPTSDTHGRVYDQTGSHMYWIPTTYFKWENNVLLFSPVPRTGYVVHRAFLDSGVTAKGYFYDAFGCGNSGGIFASLPGLDPCSTNSAHNPIGALNNAPSNNYGGMYKAVKTRGADHSLSTIYQRNFLAMIAYAQGQSSASANACAYKFINPLFPKGNNNNALSDVNDLSVTFTSSGYSNCAMTGSGVPFNKTTHNGQNCGIADLNGNMWEVQAGLTYLGSSANWFTAITFTGSGLNDMTAQGIPTTTKSYLAQIDTAGTPDTFEWSDDGGTTWNATGVAITGAAQALNDGVTVTFPATTGHTVGDNWAFSTTNAATFFRILKPSVSIAAILDDSTTAGTGAYDPGLYDALDLSGIVYNVSQPRFGNGTNPVFGMSTDTTSIAYLATCCGLPLDAGTSSGGTTGFGNDIIYRNLINTLACLCGDSWSDTSDAGVFTLALNYYHLYSGTHVGGRASVIVL